MSQALASARKRRAPASATPEPIAVPQQTSKNTNGTTSGLTLPQVIALIDKRLVTLEQFMGDSKLIRSESSVSAIQHSIESSNSESVSLNNIVEEFNSRYEILAEEILNIKNIVMSLQSYTMEVNKTLVEERIRILSDLPTSSSSNNFEQTVESFTLSNSGAPATEFSKFHCNGSNVVSGNLPEPSSNNTSALYTLNS
jgi:hypothetical protein